MHKFISAMQNLLGANWRTLLSDTLIGLASFVILAWLCDAFAQTKTAFAINTLVCLIGMFLGWAIGMFFSPFGKAQADNFKFVGKTAGAFVSGYLLSKFEKLIAKLLGAAEQDPLNYVQWERVGLFVASFLLASVVVFVSRVHAPQDEQSTHLQHDSGA